MCLVPLENPYTSTARSFLAAPRKPPLGHVPRATRPSQRIRTSTSRSSGALLGSRSRGAPEAASVPQLPHFNCSSARPTAAPSTASCHRSRSLQLWGALPLRKATRRTTTPPLSPQRQQRGRCLYQPPPPHLLLLLLRSAARAPVFQAAILTAEPTRAEAWACLRSWTTTPLPLKTSHLGQCLAMAPTAVCTEVRLGEGDTGFGSYWQPSVQGEVQG